MNDSIMEELKNNVLQNIGEVMEDNAKTMIIQVLQNMNNVVDNSREKEIEGMLNNCLIVQHQSFGMVSTFLDKAMLPIFNYLTNTKNELKNYEEYAKSLEDRLAHIEKMTCSTFLEIRNIPVKYNETKMNLVKKVLLMGTKLKMDLQQNDIKDIFLAKTKDHANRSIVVEFYTVALKDDFLHKFHHISHGKNKLTSHHLNIKDGLAIPILVIENPSTEKRPKGKKKF